MGMEGSITNVKVKAFPGQGYVVKINSHPMIQSYFNRRFLSACHLKLSDFRSSNLRELLYAVSNFPKNLRRKYSHTTRGKSVDHHLDR
jgi:hypothetical protein